MSWSRRFDEPIPPPDTGEIETLREAGDYIIALPAREHGLPHWQIAMRCLIDAAERGGLSCWRKSRCAGHSPMGVRGEPAPR